MDLLFLLNIIHRIAKVLLDKNKVKEIEDYYKKCADDGATFEDVEASKKAMSSMEIILWGNLPD